VVVIVIFFLEARMDNTPYTNQTLSFETKQDNTEQQSLVEKYKLPEELVIKKIPKSNDKINSTPEDAARSRKLQRVKSELEGQGAAPVVSTEEGKGASQPSTENRARSFRPEQASEAVAPVMEVRKPTVDVNKVYMEVDKKPTFAGGAPAFVDYLNKNLNYPKTAREDNISGRVLVTFIVERNGQISNVSVVQGIGGGCDEEAIRVMKNAPTWQPGELNGEPVRVRATIPITFRLN
jgi:TonB family protein